MQSFRPLVRGRGHRSAMSLPFNMFVGRQNNTKLATPSEDKGVSVPRDIIRDSRSVGVITAPGPDQRVGQRLFEHAAVTVSRPKREHKAVMVAFGLESSSSALA